MASQALQQRVNALWYGNNKLAYLLTPLSCLFSAALSIRKHKQTSQQIQFNVPIIIVGNVTVGGTGKTPMVVALVEALKKLDYRVGIASRGYQGNATQATLVNKQHSSTDVGDEPLLIQRKTQVHVMVGTDRVAVIQTLINDYQCDLIICDDGLQDYRFKRDVEIVMVDGERIFGNQLLLPAGPLREPVERIQQADFVVSTGKTVPAISSDSMKLQIHHAYDMNDKLNVQPLSQWQGQSVHALAAIGHPQRFFNALKAKGINIIEHEYQDHASLKHADVVFSDQLPVLMTEKDAVKCQSYNLTNTWVVALETELPKDFITRVVERIKM